MFYVLERNGDHVKKTVFIKNAAVLTASSLILRFIGIIFKVWLASSIGSEGIGLYQVIFSVYTLFAAFSTCGVCTAVTRLVANQLVTGSKSGIKKIMKSANLINTAVASVSFAVLFFGAEILSSKALNDERAILSLKALSFSLVFMGISSNIRGYFIARRKTAPFAAVSLAEQIVRIAVVLFAVSRVKGLGISYSCAAVFWGDAAAEMLCALTMNILYKKDFKRLKLTQNGAETGINREIIRISSPITGGRYLNSLLRTVENIMMPRLLAVASASALSLFGMIKGMALPILFFPGVLLNAFSTLLIPEISEASVLGKKLLLKSGTEKITVLTAAVGFIFSAVFFVAGEQIGQLIYKDEGVGTLLCLLSPIVPLMYLDSVCDGILKGLDLQSFTFKTSIADSVLRLVLIYFIVPKWGLYGFIGIMYFSNALTCLLNVGMLTKKTGAEINAFKSFILPLILAYVSVLLSNLVLRNIEAFGRLVYIILLVGFSVLLYSLSLLFFGCIENKPIVKKFSEKS